MTKRGYGTHRVHLDPKLAGVYLCAAVLGNPATRCLECGVGLLSEPVGKIGDGEVRGLLAAWETKNGDDLFKSICSDGQSSSQKKDDPRARQDPPPHALISGPLALHAGWERNVWERAEHPRGCAYPVGVDMCLI